MKLHRRALEILAMIERATRYADGELACFFVPSAYSSEPENFGGSDFARLRTLARHGLIDPAPTTLRYAYIITAAGRALLLEASR